MLKVRLTFGTSISNDSVFWCVVDSSEWKRRQYSAVDKKLAKEKDSEKELKFKNYFDN